MIAELQHWEHRIAQKARITINLSGVGQDTLEQVAAFWALVREFDGFMEHREQTIEPRRYTETV